MTTISFNQNAMFFHDVRAPRFSFAARLAQLQARQESSPILTKVAGRVIGAAAALVPVSALAWMFVTI
jgi:hypothetical protein